MHDDRYPNGAPGDPARVVVDLFAGGPSGWCLAAHTLGLEPVGIELDPAACATRAAAGYRTVRADVARLPVGHLTTAGIWGIAGSPPCQMFSQAGSGAGRRITAILARAIADQFHGRPTMAKRRKQAARVLQAASLTEYGIKGWPRAERSARGWQHATNACLVVEPARWIWAARPEWVALEQVPAVLPLWRVYATELRRLGYSAWAGILNAADYGVPQTRVRAILMASRTRQAVPPEPTHALDPRPSLLGPELAPWVSMAEALGWTRVGAVRTSYGQPKDDPKNGSHELDPNGRPSHTVTGKARAWRVETGNSTKGGTRPGGLSRIASEPSRTVDSAAGQWTVRTGVNGLKHSRDPREAEPYERPVDQPAPTLDTKAGRWKVAPEGGHAETPQEVRLRTGNHARPNDRSVPRTGDQPAPTLHFGHAASSVAWVQGTPQPDGQPWKLRNNSQGNATARGLNEPAGTLFFGGRLNDVSWVRERPATTVQGDPHVWASGHKQNGDDPPGRYQDRTGTEAVRISPAEALVLQGFPPGLPVRGTKTQAFTQIGNAFPPPLARAVLAQLVGRPA